MSRLLLVTHGADPNAADSAGCTPLFFASYAGFAKGVQMLLKKGADCNVRDQLGQTALHSVASALDEVKKRWLKPSEDGSHQGYFTIYQPTKGPGQADERHTRVAQLLIEKCKLDPLDKNDAGDTAVDLARRYDLHEMVALFEKLAPAAKLSAAEQAEYDARKPPEKAEPTAPAFAAFDLDRDGVVVRDELAEALYANFPKRHKRTDSLRVLLFVRARRFKLSLSIGHAARLVESESMRWSRSEAAQSTDTRRRVQCCRSCRALICAVAEPN